MITIYFRNGSNDYFNYKNFKKITDSTGITVIRFTDIEDNLYEFNLSIIAGYSKDESD